MCKKQEQEVKHMYNRRVHHKNNGGLPPNSTQKTVDDLLVLRLNEAI